MLLIEGGMVASVKQRGLTAVNSELETRGHETTVRATSSTGSSVDD